MDMAFDISLAIQKKKGDMLKGVSMIPLLSSSFSFSTGTGTSTSTSSTTLCSTKSQKNNAALIGKFIQQAAKTKIQAP